MKCQPIRSLDELLAWSADRWESHSRVSSVKTPRPRHPDRLPYHTLVCHDMRGGYLDDSKCAGWCGTSDAAVLDQYTLLYWNSIDEFVYFSHHFVTIPPCLWVEAAHLHGVAIYGTLITERESGYSICHGLLSDRQVSLRAIDRLVEISRHCGVDGWLVNIENKVDVQYIGELVWFVGELRRQMRRVCAWSRVIWYDAVSAVSGELVWQNALTEHNRPFLAVCDGLFLNYCWTEAGLRASALLAGPSRSADVYVGVDVFGRGCPGGGGFNTWEALAAIRSAGGSTTPLSAAIFAPGWTVQNQGAGADIVVEHRFWSQLAHHLLPHGPTQWPVVSDFSTGKGWETVENSPLFYYNLGRQSLQPSYFHVTDSDCTLAHGRYVGVTGSLALTVANHSSRVRRLPLFKCKLPLQDHMQVTLRSVQKPLKTSELDGTNVDARGSVDALCSLYIGMYGVDDGDGLGLQSSLLGHVIVSPANQRGHVTDDLVTDHVVVAEVTDLADGSDWLVFQGSLTSDQVPIWGVYIGEVGVIAPAYVQCLLGQISLSNDSVTNNPDQ